MKFKIKRIKVRVATSISDGTVIPLHDGQRIELIEEKHGIVVTDKDRGRSSLIPWENILEVQYDTTDYQGVKKESGTNTNS